MDMLTAAAREEGDYSEESEVSYPVYQQESKKERRQRQMIEKLTSFTSDFVANRDHFFRQQLTSLQMQLSTLHDGTNLQYMNAVQALDEKHEEDVAELKAYMSFLEDRAEREYEIDILAAEDDFVNAKATLKSTLLANLHNKKRRLKEDKELLDIAADNSMLSQAYSDGSSNLLSAGGIIDRRKLRHRRAHQAQDIGVDDIMQLNGKRRRVGATSSSLVSGISGLSDKEKGKERDTRMVERAERERERAVEKGLSNVKESDAIEDLNLIRRVVAQTQNGTVFARKRR